VRSRDAGFFVSFITWVSLLGVALGVAALITILSVMNGFEGELRERLLSLSAHATLTATDGAVPTAVDLERARAGPSVRAVAPFVESQALLVHGPEMQGATLRGIEPEAESSVMHLASSLVEGRIEDLTPGSRRVVLGRALAFALGVGVGDEVTVLVPAVDESGALSPRIQAFVVSGIFEVGVQDHDTVLALTARTDAAELLGASGVAGLRVTFADAFAAPVEAKHLATTLGAGWTARDWTVENAGYFRAIRIEKTMMTLILLLVVAVAAFNIVAMLVMVVRAKRNDIAILRTLGMSPGRVVQVFMAQGIAIGWGGAVLGVAGGLALASHVESVVAFLERTLHFEILDSSVYYVTRIPSIVTWPDVTLVAVLAFLLTFLATLYPARNAARVEPAVALRYE
jgi:lipoprotein-releasing system permease protein